MAAFFLILIIVALSTFPGLLLMIAPLLILGPDGAIVAISALLGIFFDGSSPGILLSSEYVHLFATR